MKCEVLLAKERVIEVSGENINEVCKKAEEQKLSDEIIRGVKIK